MSTFDEAGNQLVTLLKQYAEQTGVEIREDIHELSQYASERTAHLSRFVGQPGYVEALEAERDALAMKATNTSIDQADKIDQKFAQFISQVFTVAATFLATAVPA